MRLERRRSSAKFRSQTDDHSPHQKPGVDSRDLADQSVSRVTRYQPPKSGWNAAGHLAPALSCPVHARQPRPVLDCPENQAGGIRFRWLNLFPLTNGRSSIKMGRTAIGSQESAGQTTPRTQEATVERKPGVIETIGLAFGPG